MARRDGGTHGSRREMRAGDRQRPGGCKGCRVDVRRLEAHVRAILAVEDVRKVLGALDAEQHESGQALRVGLDRGNVDPLGGERLAHEAAHVLVADARQHRDLKPEARQADGDVARRAAEVLGEVLRILEARAALEAVEVDGRAAEADEVERRNHLCFADALPPAGGGSQIFAPGCMVHACSAVNSGTS